MQDETKPNSQKQVAEPRNGPCVSSLLAKPEWLRRYKTLTGKLDWENLSIDGLHSVDDESKELVELNPDYRIRTGEFTAGAVLARPKPETPGEAGHELIKISERARAEIERRKKPLEAVSPLRRTTNPLKDAIRKAKRQVGPDAHQDEIAETADCILKDRKSEFRKVCPRTWLGWPVKSLMEAFNHPKLEKRVKTFISKYS